jgi:hypothetical protein
MNLGIVGVGPWGRTLASSFERSGSTIVAYDRADRDKKINDMEVLMPWQEMIESPTVEIIACAGPPDVTMKVFLACQAKRKPSFLTKPFLIYEVPKNLSAPTYIDYVTLASPIYQKLRKSATMDYEVEKLEIDFYGSGPERSFPGFVDYGSQALAIAHDLLGLAPLEDVRASSALHPEVRNERQLVMVEAKAKDVKMVLCAGNGASGMKRTVEASLKRGPRVTYDELNRVATFCIDDKLATRMPGHDPLALMVERFLWDVDVGRVNPYFVELSAAVARSLDQVRALI